MIWYQVFQATTNQKNMLKKKKIRLFPYVDNMFSANTLAFHILFKNVLLNQ